MKTITVSAQKDHLERLASVSPMKALSELIWNGLDAGSGSVKVDLEQNKMSGLEKIRVWDDGTGISYEEVEVLFGNLGNSWKKSKMRFMNRTLHGAKGEGRFKAFALGNRVEWNTVYCGADQKSHRYQIIGRADVREKPSFTTPIAANGDATGTEVLITEIDKGHGVLLEDNATEELAKHFAAYLTKYPNVKIEFNGLRVDPSTIQERTKDLIIDDLDLGNGKKITVEISVIEWKTPTKRVLHLCDSGGVTLHEVEAGPHIKAPGFHFTAYVKTDHLKELNKDGLLAVEDLHQEVNAILKASRKAVHRYFRKRLAEQHVPAVQRWKAENIYPFEEKPSLTPVEEAERQVFDIIAVNVESYLPDFEESDHKSKQFVFMLLAQALRKNPESLQEILTEVLKLKPRQLEDLADLLKRTSFPAIITSAKTVANRLDFLLGLENLIFGKDTKKKLRERDQLHKILENEAWIFDEEFSLSASEERLEEVLELHLDKLGPRADEGPVLREDDKQGRIDLMLSRVIQPRHDERDHLVVELKRPSQKINSEILSQVESYAIAVAQDPRFFKEKTRWRFIVVSNEMDEHAKRKTRQRQRKPGLVFDDAELNIEVWGFEWTEVIAAARARLQFINERLCYEANRDSAREYLEKTHSKFIPNMDEEEDAGDSTDEVGKEEQE